MSLNLGAFGSSAKIFYSLGNVHFTLVLLIKLPKQLNIMRLYINLIIFQIITSADLEAKLP